MAKQVNRPDGKQQPAPTPKPVEGRYCEVCGIKLSGYNPGPNCWAHTIGYPWRGPTAKPKY